MNRVISFLTLFTSFSTLICCALPALFVVLGMGAALAGIVSSVPQLVWFSEHKEIVFGFGAFMLLFGAYLRWQAKKKSCPIDPKLKEACRDSKNWSGIFYWSSVTLYVIGAFFAFIAPSLFN